MSEEVAAAAVSARGGVNVPYLVAASILSGIGIFAMSFWIYSQNLPWLGVGIVLEVAGGYLLFQRGTGPDAA